jgi:tetratricopeptide (TPR) repeat protein
MLCPWKRGLFLSLILLPFFYPPLLSEGYCAGELYKYQDKDGKWVITDKPRKDSVSKEPEATKHYLEYLSQGHDYAEAGDFNKALEAYTEAIELKSDGTDGYVGRGACNAHLGNYQLAEKDFDMAIQLNPGNYQAYWARALLHTTLRNFDKAVDDYSRVIDLNQDFAAMAYANRGWVYRNRLRDSQQAISDYTMAIKLKAGSALVYYHRACALLDTRKYREAVEDLSKAIELEEDFAGAYALRGFVYQEYLGQPEKGEKDIDYANKLLKKTPIGKPGMPFTP